MVDILCSRLEKDYLDMLSYSLIRMFISINIDAISVQNVLFTVHLYDIRYTISPSLRQAPVRAMFPVNLFESRVR
jgi:hypothetical protein